MRRWVVGVVLGWSLACGGTEPAGGGGGGGAAIGEEPAPEPGGGRQARGGHKAKSGPERHKTKVGRGGGGGDGGGDDPGDDDGGGEAPAPDPEPSQVVCYAVATYDKCPNETRPNDCTTEEVRAGGPGSSRTEAEAMALEACSAHLTTMLSAGIN